MKNIKRFNEHNSYEQFELIEMLQKVKYDDVAHGIVLDAIERGIDVNCPGTESLFKPIHMCAKNGWIKTLNLTLENGGDINLITGVDLTPLSVAMIYTQEESARELLLRGARITPDIEMHELDLMFDGDFSWYPGGRDAITRKIRASSTRKKMF